MSFIVGSDFFVCPTVKKTTAVPSIPIINEPSCYGDNDGQANIIPTGGSNQFTVSWTQSGLSGFSQINLSAGIYDVIVTDQKGVVTADRLLFDIKKQNLNIISLNNNKINARINMK